MDPIHGYTAGLELCSAALTSAFYQKELLKQSAHKVCPVRPLPCCEIFPLKCGLAVHVGL